MELKDLEGVLERIEAPSGLLSWLQETQPDDAQAAVRGCTDPVWLVWLEFAAGRPCLDAVNQVLAQLSGLATRLPGKAAELGGFLHVAYDGKQEVLSESADAAEELANNPPEAYREQSGPLFSDLCRALAWILRAFDGIETARARLEALRMERARALASMIGGAVHAALPPPAAPLVLQANNGSLFAVNNELVYATAATAEATALLVPHLVT